jgi:riboflavin biosynthesis pyrimidine reductase
VFSTRDAGPVIIMSTAANISAQPGRARALECVGAELEPLQDTGLLDALQRLGDRSITSLLLEGGPRLHRAAWRAGVVDQLQLYITPKRLAGGVPWLSAEELSLWDLDTRVRACVPDVRLDAYVHRTD